MGWSLPELCATFVVALPIAGLLVRRWIWNETWALRARRTTWRGRPHIDLLDCAFYGLERSFNYSHEGGTSDQCRLS